MRLIREAPGFPQWIKLDFTYNLGAIRLCCGLHSCCQHLIPYPFRMRDPGVASEVLWIVSVSNVDVCCQSPRENRRVRTQNPSSVRRVLANYLLRYSQAIKLVLPINYRYLVNSKKFDYGPFFRRLPHDQSTSSTSHDIPTHSTLYCQEKVALR